jgi:hydroxyacylglutathione hydrolase
MQKRMIVQIPRMFQRFYDEGLAQASFLLGCDRTRQVVVIDPRRDASIYVEAARQAGATIVAAIETHVHADFVSGARELSSAGIGVLTGPGAGLAYDHHQVSDGETLAVGDVTLTFLHTPGHTFEHIAVLADAPGEPPRLFTGDLLFVGGVGRPDLLGEAQARELAAQLFTSLERLMRMDRRVEVHPGHGAGSLCGAGIGHDPSSTIGREHDQNPMLRLPRDEFVAAVLADLPGTPPYFARMKRVNLAPDLRGLAAAAPTLPSIRAAAGAALAADGAMIVDLRQAGDFQAAHADGAVNLGYGSKVGYWAGWVLRPDVPLLLMAESVAHAQDAFVQLLRVGLDRVEGVIDGGFAAWQGSGLPVASTGRISAAEARQGGDRLILLDVRTAREWDAGHLPGALNIPVGELPARIGELPAGRTIATICEGGYRSSLAASLLTLEGVPGVVNVTGGMAAVRDLPA